MTTNYNRRYDELKEKRKAFISEHWYLWILIALLIGGCFILFEQESEEPVTKYFNVVEMAKAPSSYLETKCKNERDCNESLRSYLMDELIFSDNGCLESQCDSNDSPRTYYLSSLNKLYSSAKAANEDEVDSIDEVSYEIKRGVGRPYATLRHTRNCYVYGLICPEGFDYENQYESITMDIDLKVKRYDSDCSTYNNVDMMGDYYSVCHHHNPRLVSITSILKEVKSYSYE